MVFHPAVAVCLSEIVSAIKGTRLWTGEHPRGPRSGWGCTHSIGLWAVGIQISVYTYRCVYRRETFHNRSRGPKHAPLRLPHPFLLFSTAARKGLAVPWPCFPTQVVVCALRDEGELFPCSHLSWGLSGESHENNFGRSWGKGEGTIGAWPRLLDSILHSEVPSWLPVGTGTAAPSLEVLNARLNGALDRMGWSCIGLKVSSNPSHSMTDLGPYFCLLCS